MSPAKPVRTRIREPRGKENVAKRRKTGDFSVARRPAPSRKGATGALALGRATYSMSVHDPRELPRAGAPELAFAGRSNAGKSSAINTLTGRRRLAFVSKTPGRTQLINFFSLGEGAFLVDLPGYGYAGVPGEVQRHWKTLVSEYITTRESLAAGVVVLDPRHPPTPLARQFVGWLHQSGRPPHLLS